MLGQSRVQVQDLQQTTLDPLARFGAQALYQLPYSVPYAVATFVDGLATVGNHGVGLLSASNKPSETNIQNGPIYFTTQQLPTLTLAPQQWRNISYPIPGPTNF